jgi:WD40 repeat protein
MIFNRVIWSAILATLDTLHNPVSYKLIMLWTVSMILLRNDSFFSLDQTGSYILPLFFANFLTHQADITKCSGDINVMHVNIGQLQLCQSLRGGHTEIVRSIHWNPQDNVMFSGGEDAKLCTWSNAPPPADGTTNGVVRSLPSRMQTKRHSPY